MNQRFYFTLDALTSVDSLLAFLGKIEKRSANSCVWLLTLEICEIGISYT